MSPLDERAREPFGILFVCLGNLCRSPMAEGIARDELEREYPGSTSLIRFSSAGVAAIDGEPATREAVRAMRERGIDISRHRARRVTTSMVESSGLVLVMEERYGERLRRSKAATPVYLLTKLGEAAGEVLKAPRDTGDGQDIESRLARLTAAAEAMDLDGRWARPGNEYDVLDPIGLALSVYTAVAGSMERPIRDILRIILEGAPQPR
ncbi:MAG: arsenate reductase/protein-tyrosine-phosphatase family protein [Candidatus Geothermincolia bacterium]